VRTSATDPAEATSRRGEDHPARQGQGVLTITSGGAECQRPIDLHHRIRDPRPNHIIVRGRCETGSANQAVSEGIIGPKSPASDTSPSVEIHGTPNALRVRIGRSGRPVRPIP
jgi:hypothetical protein